MKQTQILFLTFAATKSSTTARIHVPFKVKTIHTKAISLSTGNSALATGEYVTIESDLVNGSPLGSTFNISSFSAGTIQDIVLAAKSGASGVAIASMLHYDKFEIKEIKHNLATSGLSVRIV